MQLIISKIEMLSRDDLELVMAIRERGSLAATALAMDVAPSVVTKRLAALESRLGLRLFQRSTRRVSPTAEAEVLQQLLCPLKQGFGLGGRADAPGAAQEQAQAQP